MNKTPLIVANWKMNPAVPAQAVLLAKKIEKSLASVRNVEVVVAPPFPFLIPVASALKRTQLGSQDACWQDVGPYTGDVSWRQLQHLNVTYSIVGHSERRTHAGETDEMVNKKVRALLENNMVPILCIGEHERTGDDIPAYVGEQIEHALDNVKKIFVKNLVIAYEPIWAISTTPHAHPNTPENTFRAMIYIRQIISKLYGRMLGQEIRVIYGGSVTAKNIRAFLVDGHTEGALVGSASIDPKEFSEIIHIASKATF